jgi:hypothetical protein
MIIIIRIKRENQRLAKGERIAVQAKRRLAGEHVWRRRIGFAILNYGIIEFHI